jgi:hypothetical protein
MIKYRKWAEQVAHIGDKGNAYRLIVEKPQGKGPLGRPKCRWMDIIEIIPRENRMVEYGVD